MYEFKIRSGGFHWLGDEKISSQDLCLHGQLELSINEEKFESDCCVSASALKLLKTLTENHEAGQEGNQIIPCCGNTLIANPELDSVEIVGCNQGIDFDVKHDGAFVYIKTMTNTHKIPIQIYSYEIIKFAKDVKNFYDKSEEKEIPESEFERDGYIAFWNEWNRRFEEAKCRIKRYTLLDLQL